MVHNKQNKQDHWIPDPMVLIFGILVIGAALTHLVPAGEFDREIIGGITRIVDGSYHLVTENPATVLDVFVAIPRGLIEASQYLFIVFIAGGLFHLIRNTGAMETGIGVLVNSLGPKNQHAIIILTTFVFGFFGAAVGFENNIALVPIGVVVARAVGCSNVIGAGMAVGGIGVGFALSPINPYTVGVAQGVAELALFSGWELRLTLLLSALSGLCFFLLREIKFQKTTQTDSADITKATLNGVQILTLAIFVSGLAAMLFGIFRYGWYINEIAAVFLILSILIGIVNRLGANDIVTTLMEGASQVTSGALVIGVAASIKVVLDDGKITDTIIYELSTLLQGTAPIVSAISMSMVQGIVNIFIPGGSGQALVTMPVMAPLGDMLNLSRQVTVLAFQVGDGITNLIVPTSGGTLAMLAIARIDYATWLRFIWVYVVAAYLLSWAFLAVAVAIGY